MLPTGCPKTFQKTYGATTVIGVDKRRRDEAERRGATHTTTPIARCEEAEPYVAGSTTVAGSTSDAAVERGTDVPGDLAQYPRHRRKQRDQNVGKRLDVHIRGRNAHARVISALCQSFPNQAAALRSAGKEIIISGVGARRRVMDALRPLGGKITTE
jgi:hypothetical protein